MTTYRFGDRGPLVRHLQECLIALLSAHDPAEPVLPRWGADGHLGHETWAALQRAADVVRIDPLPEPAPGVEVYDDLDAAVVVDIDGWRARAEDDEPEPTRTPDCSGERCVERSRHWIVYDEADERVASRPKVRLDRRGQAVVRRAEAIDSVMLHMMAVPMFGLSDRQLAAAGGDRTLALARRGLGVSAHQAVFFERPMHPPLIVDSAPILWHLNHGNRANPFSLGLEVEGIYEGVVGDPRSLWRYPEPSDWDAIRDAAAHGLARLVERGRAAGCPLRWVIAHRQSSATAGAGPGPGAVVRNQSPYPKG